MATRSARPTRRRSRPPAIDPPAWEIRKPVIAAVNGHAIGLGLTLAIQCDLRFMAADAKYGVVQVRRGVMGDAFVHWSLPRIVGMANAAEILLTGRTFDGHEMQRLGVASRCLPNDEVLPAAWEVAHDIAVNTAPMSVAFSKRLLWQSFELDRAEIGRSGDRAPPPPDGERRRTRGRDGVPGAARSRVDEPRVARLAGLARGGEHR